MRSAWSPFPDTLRIARGEDSKRTPRTISGFNLDIDNAWETLWPVGGIYAYPAAGMQMEVLSSSGNDAPANTGVQQVVIQYLDTNYVEQIEVLATNGVGVVPTVATNILRINNFSAGVIGTNGSAVGNITLRGFGGGAVYSYIIAGETRSKQAVCTIPDGKRLYLIDWALSACAPSAGHYARIRWMSSFDFCTGAPQTFLSSLCEFILQDSTFRVSAGNGTLMMPMSFPERTDIQIQAISDNASANAIVSTWSLGWLETT